MLRTLQEVVDNLSGIDDIFFFKLAEDKEFCEELLQVILENKNIKIVSHRPQSVIRNIKGHSVILDLECLDENNTLFDVEIQKHDNDDHQRRVRYNMANLDTKESEKGIKFKELKDIFMIYISDFDIFNSQKTIYHIDRIIRETGELADNGTHEIYVNTKIDDGTEIAEYMQMLKQKEIPDNPKFPKLCKTIKGIKTGKGDGTMCDLVQEYAEEYAKEYAKEYADQEKMKLLADMFNKEIITSVVAGNQLGITEEKFLEFVEEYNKTQA